MSQQPFVLEQLKRLQSQVDKLGSSIGAEIRPVESVDLPVDEGPNVIVIKVGPSADNPNGQYQELIFTDKGSIYYRSGSLTEEPTDPISIFTGNTKPNKDDIGLGNVDNVKQAPHTHVGQGGTEAHPDVTDILSGFMTPALKKKLDGIQEGANKYTHPTGDGNQHVPATGTGNNGKVLKAGAAAGSASWGNVAFSELTGVEQASPKFKDVQSDSLRLGNMVLSYNANTKSIDFNTIV